MTSTSSIAFCLALVVLMVPPIAGVDAVQAQDEVTLTELPANVRGSLTPGNASKIYKVSLAAEKNYVFLLEAANDQTLDPSLRLEDPTGAELRPASATTRNKSQSMVFHP